MSCGYINFLLKLETLFYGKLLREFFLNMSMYVLNFERPCSKT